LSGARRIHAAGDDSGNRGYGSGTCARADEHSLGCDDGSCVGSRRAVSAGAFTFRPGVRLPQRPYLCVSFHNDHRRAGVPSSSRRAGASPLRGVGPGHRKRRRRLRLPIPKSVTTMINLTGKVALITGASRGIGAATAIQFAQAGIRGLVINYHRDSKAARQVAASCEGLGAETLLIRADVSSVAAVGKMIDSAVARFGSLDILVANAGIWKEAAIEKMSEAEWDKTIDVNLKSIYACCHAAAGVMLPRKRGTMILVSSTAGQRGEPFHSHYAAS